MDDNTGLFHSLKGPYPVLPVFIFDPEILDKLEDKHDARVSFLHMELGRIKKELSSLGTDLCIINGKPIEVFRKLFNSYVVKSIFTNRDYEPYSISRDEEINEFAKENGATFHSYKDQVLFEKGEILSGSGEPYKVFTPFKKRWLQKLNEEEDTSMVLDNEVSNFVKGEVFHFPSLNEIGFKSSSISFPDRKIPLQIISKYGEERDYPAKDATSRLGIHFRHGTVSIRDAVRSARKLSDIWLNELIWREFYSHILAWFPHVVNNSFKPKYDLIPWINNTESFEKWCKGITGYPLVDAGMRQLNETGYMHNRVRMLTASFLTKHLLIDWRLGEAYFAKKLLDFELASNNGGWQWAAGTGTDAQPYFRVFNPSNQIEKFDRQLTYVKKWIPEFGTSSYPEPIVDHKFARQRAIDTYKQALQ